MGNQNDSLKSVIVNVYNINTDLVASSNSELTPGVGIVSLKYKYDDDNEDECVIKIQATHNDWLDKLGLHIDVDNDTTEAMVIRVSWGYIGGPFTPVRTVVVRDIKSKYGPNVIWTELHCTDFTTYLKLTQSPFIEKLSPIDYIRRYCTEKVGVTIIVDGEILYEQGIDEKYGQVDKSLEVLVIPPGTMESYKNHLEGIPSNYTNKPKAIYKVTEKDIDVGQWYDIENTEVKEFLEKVRDLNVVSKSPFTVLKGIMEKAPKGPWYITGRDNTLMVHNRSLKAGVYKAYHYQGEPGDLLDFTVETKYDTFSKRNISFNGLDPQAKAAKFLDAYMESLEKLDSPEKILKSASSDEEKAKKLMEWLNVKQNGYQRFATSRTPYQVWSSGKANFTEYATYNPSIKKPLPKALDPLTLASKAPLSEADLDYVIQTGIYYSTPISDMDENTNVVNNSARKLAMEKEEAKFLVEGDPTLRTGFIVSIAGVLKVHRGRYYIKSCEHEISTMGYKTTMDTFKLVSGTGITHYNTDEKYTTDDEGNIVIDHAEKEETEYNLFRRLEVKVAAKGKTKFSANIGLQSGSAEKVYEYISLDEYLKLQPDTKMDDIVKLYKVGKIRFVENTEIR